MAVDDLAIYDAIAAVLAGSRETDLSSFDPAQVRTALERVLTFPVPRRNFLGWLDGRVRVLSDGRVSIEERAAGDRPPGEPPAGADGPGPGPGPAPELPLRVVVDGEPFAEPAVVCADGPVVQFPMRG